MHIKKSSQMQCERFAKIDIKYYPISNIKLIKLCITN
jgi:hypothetical protein